MPSETSLQFCRACAALVNGRKDFSLHILENNELVAELRSEIEIFLRDFPKSNEGHLINARLQVSIGEADKALAALKKMGKKNARLYFELQRSYREEGDLDALEKGRAFLEAQQNISIGDRDTGVSG